MKFRILQAVSAAALIAGATPALAQTEIQWWHAMGGALGEKVDEIAAGFNATQSDFAVVPVFKGNYTETMTAAIAGFRTGQQPHLVQVFEVGTATMMAAEGAIYPVHELMADTGEPFDPGAFLSSVAGYYTTTDGDMLSMPFNSSTPVMYYNKEAFAAAGLDPDSPPATWPEFEGSAARRPRRPAIPAVSPPPGRAGCRSRTTRPGTTCRWAPRPTASVAWTPSSPSTAPAMWRM